MHSFRYITGVLGLVMIIGIAHGQSFNSGKNRKTYKGLETTYPHHSLGFKLGDPIAISYRFYLSEKFSFGADFGKAASSLYNRYFQNAFDNYIAGDTFKTSSAQINYLSHRVRGDFVGEAKFIYHFGLLSPGLRAFTGAGWQWKETTLDYTYTYRSDTIENRPGVFRRKRLTMGPQFILGLEYSYVKIPVKAFLEMEYYTDVQIDPGHHRFEGGVGLRYTF